MTSWHSYPKIYNIGHSAISSIFEDDVIVEEKVDGSQFSFGVFDGKLKCRSKGVEIIPEEMPEGHMFLDAVTTADVLRDKGLLVDGVTYRCEYLQKPKHNVLSYDRIPKQHLMLFDINTGEEQYLSYEAKAGIAAFLGLECVPLLYKGKISSPEQLKALLELTSVLGGQKIEGFVCKNYARFCKDGKAMMAKYVSEAFKEKHGKTWKDENPKQGDILSRLAGQYRTEARFDKAIIHLRERAALSDSPKDIGELIREVQSDLRTECGDEIKETLFHWAWSQLSRAVVAGLPEYYKKYLMQKQFEGQNGQATAD
jgi:hypothetical protein